MCVCSSTPHFPFFTTSLDLWSVRIPKSFFLISVDFFSLDMTFRLLPGPSFNHSQYIVVSCGALGQFAVRGLLKWGKNKQTKNHLLVYAFAHFLNNEILFSHEIGEDWGGLLLRLGLWATVPGAHPQSQAGSWWWQTRHCPKSGKLKKSINKRSISHI